jgi:hypothetical protein
MTVVKAAAVQIRPVLYSREGTVEKVAKKIRELGRKVAQFKPHVRERRPMPEDEQGAVDFDRTTEGAVERWRLGEHPAVRKFG